MLRIAGFPVWVGPSDMVAGARAVLDWTDDAVELVASLPRRVTGLLDGVDELVERISAAADRVDVVAIHADAIADRVDAVALHADTVADRVGEVTEAAAALVLRAGQVTAGAADVADGAGVVVERSAVAAAGAAEILGVYEPILERAAPLAQAFVAEFSRAELDAAVRLIDQLPQLTEHLETDIMPILATLDRVGPDVHELLDVLKDTRLAIQGIPGFGMLRRRGEEREDREDAEQNGR